MANGTLPISSGTTPSTNNASTAQGWITAGSAAVGALGDYFGNKGASASSTTSRPPWLDAATQDIFGRAKGLADRPYTPYQGQRVASLSGNEQMAINNAASLSGKYQPLIDRSSKEFNSGNLQQYMNPYTEGVLDVNARKINSQFDKQLSSLNSKRGMMDAFGSDRGTLLESQLNRGRAQTLSDANIQGLSDAYDKGSSAFFNDKNSALNTAYVGSALDNQAISAQANTGALSRGVDQAQKDFDYGQFIESRDWSMNNFTSLLNALNAASGAAGKTTSESSKNATNIGGTLAGLAQTVAGAYINQQNNSAGGTTGGALGGKVTTPENASGALTPPGGTVTDTPGGTTTYFGPNSAGGEAAGLTDFGGKAINNANDLDPVTPSVQKLNPDGSTTYTSGGALNGIKGAVDIGSSVLGAYQGVKQGGVGGYSQAAANAAALGSKAGVSGAGAIGSVAGGVAGGVGLVNGIQNKDPVSTLNGAGQVSGAISSSSLTSGSALGTSLAASGAATALPMAALMFMVTDMINAGADKRTAMNEVYIRSLLGKGPKDNWNVGGRVPMFKLPSGEMIRPGKSMEAASKAFFSGDQAAYEKAYADMIKNKGN